MEKKEPKKEGVNLSKERDERLVPLARKLLLAIVAKEDLCLGSGDSITTEEAAEYYQKQYVEIVIPILLEENIKLNEIDYLFQLMGQPVHFVKEVVGKSLSLNRDIADAGLYGVKDIDELTIGQLDQTLKDIAKKYTKEAKESVKKRAK